MRYSRFLVSAIWIRGCTHVSSPDIPESDQHAFSTTLQWLEPIRKWISVGCAVSIISSLYHNSSPVRIKDLRKSILPEYTVFQFYQTLCLLRKHGFIVSNRRYVALASKFAEALGLEGYNYDTLPTT